MEESGLMRSVYFMLILFVLLAIGLSLISCTNKFNFVCNDIFDSTLTLNEKADILEKCSKGQLMWRKEF